MDAPSHFVPGKPSIDKIPPNRFVADALLLKVPKKANQLVEAGEIKGHGIRENDAIVIATGWEKQAGAKNYMSENPGLSAGAARYFAGKRISIVAIDGPSIDAGKNSAFTAHKLLLAKNVLVVENLCNLDRIPRDRFRLVVAPLKFQGATGSPVRALAVL